MLKIIALGLLLGCLCQAASLGQPAEPGAEPLMRETYRPRYHYSPVRNFMNDPNGLVYHRGEYHLFHQYNPFGNQWGHMSWGHAVSRDLVHWEHLPVALQEADGVMIFSGSAVVDERNTSGFGTKENPPMVAIYTGHRPADEMQSQCLAYSLDNGRTWTKYAGNPVIPWEKDFRDPKVFWHAPTRRWVMAVVKAADRRLRFYGSPDLKRWELLSEFGPAGVPDTVKANWECPDLFPLPIEGEPGKSKWVLHVGMGNGHVNGGSGGEYFIGEFDGTTFRNDNPPSTILWADYGRDNYAAVSWSGITGKRGERYWIGWMSNWQYANDVPTHPWRNVLTLPRALKLRRTPEGLRMVQEPVPQLRSLRGEKHTVRSTGLTPEKPLVLDRSAWGDAVEIVAELELGGAAEVGLTVRAGEGEETRVGYDAGTKQLFVDRTRSGKSDFNQGFAGRSGGPMPLRGRRVKLHLFVDRSSVEVFGNDGETVLSELIFPRPESQGISVYSRGGEARLVRMEVWKLRSALGFSTQRDTEEPTEEHRKD
ncbi:MAG: glycoside hydrolase family 32 protein [Armatimonadota bacterium]